MDSYIALVAYGCTIRRGPTESVDFQVRVFRGVSAEAVEREIRSEAPHQYENEDGEVVSWPLACVLAIERLEGDGPSGAEVVGAITSLATIADSVAEATVRS